MQSGYVINTITGKAQPIEKLADEELTIIPRKVLTDTSSGVRIRPYGNVSEKIVPGATYRCETEWALVSGFANELAAFDSREKAVKALNLVTEAVTKMRGNYYIA